MQILVQQLSIFFSTTTDFSVNTKPVIRISDLFYDHKYNKYYTNLATLLTLDIIPISCLIYYNARIVKAMKTSNDIVSQSSNQYNRSKQEKSLVRVMTGIVVVFILCHSLRGIVFIYIFVRLEHIHTCNEADSATFLGPLWFYILFSLNCILFEINSSVNMLIYCCVNSTFRKHLISFILPCRSRSISTETAITFRTTTA